MSKKIAFFLCFLFLISCHAADEVKIPNNVLPKETMAAIFVDVHLMEAAMNLSLGTLNKASVGTANELPPIDIFTTHGTTKQQFDESYTFYTKHPEILNDVYQLVLNDLSKMQAEAMKK